MYSRILYETSLMTSALLDQREVWSKEEYGIETLRPPRPYSKKSIELGVIQSSRFSKHKAASFQLTRPEIRHLTPFLLLLYLSH